MSVVAWLDRDGVALRVAPTFSAVRAFRNMPQLEHTTLLAKLKKGCCVREFNDTLYRCYPRAAGYPIFKLDILLCLREIELIFGAVASPLGGIRLSGSLWRNPLQRQPLAGQAPERYILSRFAYQHRVDDELVLDCPLSDVRCVVTSDLLAQVLFRCGRESQPVATLLALTQDDTTRQGLAELLGVLVQRHVLTAVGTERKVYRRTDEPQAQQAQWDFHNMLFHVESTQGYHSELDTGHRFGACFPYRGRFAEPPAEHPPFAGDNIALPDSRTEQQATSFIDVLQQRKSIRTYDTDNPITMAELSTFLALTMRGKAVGRTVDWQQTGIKVTVAKPRAYASGGATYEQEIYLTVLRSDDLERGFYHYNPFTHALTRIVPAENSWQFYLKRRFAPSPAAQQPDILFMFAARYHRITWKYSRMSYAIVLKNIGCLYQTMYLVATFMGLAPCGQGGGDHRMFAALSGQDPWQEGIAGEFALGRPASGSTDAATTR